MSNRDWMIIAFAAGAIAGIGGLVWLMTRDRPGTGPNSGSESVAVAAEPTVGSPTITVIEYGPVRKGTALTCRAFRRQESGSAVVYGISIPIGETLIVEPDAKALLDFWEKYSTFKFPESSDRPEMVATLTIRTLAKGSAEITFDLASGQGKIFEIFELKDIDFIRAAYKDIEALKKVPISAKP